ncbi:MAG: hypothetical protein AB7N76_30575 [Planctomycetota bacterium]
MNPDFERPERPDPEQGSAMIITIVVVLMLAGMMILTTQGAVLRSNTSQEQSDGLECLNAADTGIALAIQASSQSGTLTAGTTTYTLPGFGAVVVTVTDFGSNGVDDDGDGLIDGADKKESGVYRITSKATNSRGISRGVEIYQRKSFHELFYKAIYVGNSQSASYTLNLGPGSGAPNGNGAEGTWSGNSSSTDYPGSSWENWVQNGDFVDGDIHINGTSILISGQTDIYGDVASTGGIMGKPVNGTKDTNASPIDPPDLAAEDYDTLASTSGGVWHKGDSGLPSWLFDSPVGSYKSSPYDYITNASKYSLNNFHFAGNNSTVPVTSADDGKIFVVKGNLWIDTRGQTQFKWPTTTNGIKFTVVVEGNLYIADGLSYKDATKDGVLFIVKAPDASGTASYLDDDMNGVIDNGETLIYNNDPNATPATYDGSNYSGPKEGYGNIWFGDKVASQGGVTDGYFYAQNNVYIAPTAQTKQAYGVYGFLSSGGQFLAGDRASGKKYPSLRVKYDARLENGTVEFPGMPAPAGSGSDSTQIVLWRQTSGS